MALDIRTIVDEYAELQYKIQLVRPIIARADELRSSLQAVAADTPADMPLVLNGRRFQAQMGKCSVRRAVGDMKKLYGHLGREVFLRVCSVPVSAIDRLVSPSEATNLLVQDRSGPRPIKVVARQLGAR